MPDLRDGETAEVKGSGSKPYVLKNVGGVYSCTCPAWRNQSQPIERRTCKHLRAFRGDEAETARLGSPAALPASRTAAKKETEGPPLLLAERWDNDLDLSGWWMSEKLDGFRAYWDGQKFVSRLGNLIHAPDWFMAGLPDVPLDGELWLGRKAFQRTSSIVRRQDKGEQWKEVRFVVFDAPGVEDEFEARVAFLKRHIEKYRPPYAAAHAHELCRDLDHLRRELARVEQLGGEGLMLRQPGSRYEVGRSTTLLKVKTFHDAEARVIGHQAGAGRHKGRLGALLVQLASGVKFSVGTGFSDAQRESPPPVGSVITFRYQELSEGGVPRFPSYVGVRADAPPSVPIAAPAALSPTAARASVSVPAAPPAAPRRFEFAEGATSKFWEVWTSGRDLTTRWGKIGSDGQSKTKSFKDAAAAAAEMGKLIAEKTAKGYVEK